MVFTLRSLAQHPSSPVSRKSKAAIDGLKDIAAGYGLRVDSLINRPLDEVASALQQLQQQDSESSLQLDAVLLEVVSLQRMDTLGSVLEPFRHVDPQAQDMLLTDVDAEDLRSDVAERLNVVYLGAANPASIAFPVQGTFYGENYRPMVNLIVSKGNVHINVIFLVDTGSPHSFLCAEAFNALGYTESIPRSAEVHCHGLRCEVHCSNAGSHFEEINILGATFFSSRLDLIAKYSSGELLLMRP